MWYKAHPYKAGRGAMRYGSHFGSISAVILLTVIVLGAGANGAAAQSLNWEGQDGIFVTPLAYGFRRPTRASADPLLLITTWTLGKFWADSIRYRSPWVRSTGLSLDTRGTSTRRAVQPALVSYGAAASMCFTENSIFCRKGEPGGPPYP